MSLPCFNIIIIERLCSPVTKEAKPQVLNLSSRQTLDSKTIARIEARKMVQQVKVLASKTEDLSSSPNTGMAEREKRLPQAVL